MALRPANTFSRGGVATQGAPSPGPPPSHPLNPVAPLSSRPPVVRQLGPRKPASSSAPPAAPRSSFARPPRRQWPKGRPPLPQPPPARAASAQSLRSGLRRRGGGQHGILHAYNSTMPFTCRGLWTEETSSSGQYECRWTIHGPERHPSLFCVASFASLVWWILDYMCVFLSSRKENTRRPTAPPPAACQESSLGLQTQQPRVLTPALNLEAPRPPSICARRRLSPRAHGTNYRIMFLPRLRLRSWVISLILTGVMEPGLRR